MAREWWYAGNTNGNSYISHDHRHGDRDSTWLDADKYTNRDPTRLDADGYANQHRARSLTNAYWHTALKLRPERLVLHSVRVDTKFPHSRNRGIKTYESLFLFVGIITICE